MVEMLRHVKVRAQQSESDPSTFTVACACGWRSDPPTADDDRWVAHFNEFIAREGLRGLASRDAILQLIEIYSDIQHVHWRAEEARVVSLAMGWWVTVNRSADALMFLYHVDHFYEALPVFRCLFEHALFLHALVNQGERAVDAAIAEQTRHRRNLGESIVKGPIPEQVAAAGFSLPQELLRDEPDAATTPVKDSMWTQQIQAICDRTSTSGTLYVVYRLICNYVHPSVRGAWQFVKFPDHLDSDEDGPSGEHELDSLDFYKGTHLPIESDLLFWTAVLMIWAGYALAKLLEQPDLRAEIEPLAKELGVPPLEDFPDFDQFGALDISTERIGEILFGPRSLMPQASPTEAGSSSGLGSS